VYFAAPADWSEADERSVVEDVAALLPPLVQLEFEGRYAAMLSHEPKNYALLGYDGTLVLRGVAFRSSRAEPFGEAFLRRAIGRLLVGDVVGVRDAYVDAVTALQRMDLPTFDVSSRVRLTKTPDEYRESRANRRELPYEAMLAGARTWRAGERARVYRKRDGSAGLASDDDSSPAAARDYDVDHYRRVLRENFATRLARAFTSEDFATIFADPEQPSLFSQAIETITPVLRVLPRAGGSDPEDG
jgi:DNA polymerase elongation subunit (family B)